MDRLTMVLNDKAWQEAQDALGEFLQIGAAKYAAAVCVSAYLTSVEKQKKESE